MDPQVEQLVQSLHQVLRRWVNALVLHALGEPKIDSANPYLDTLGPTGRIWQELRETVPEETLKAFEREIHAVLAELRYLAEEFLRLNARPPSEAGRAWAQARLRLDEFPDRVARLPLWRRAGPPARG